MRKNVCFWCIFGCWIQIYLQNFFITHTFRSRLKGWNLLQQNTKVCFYCGRHEEFKDFFSQKDGVGFCNNVCSIMEVLGHEFKPDQWHLFIDCQKWAWRWFYSTTEINSPPFLLAHEANMKESYESIKLLLGKIKYDEFKWKLCDIKVVALLLGMQLRYTKYCFSCVSGTAGTRRITV